MGSSWMTASMGSVEAKVGQLFITHLRPEGRLQEAMRDFRDSHYGGVFLSSRNIRSTDQIRRLTHRFRAHTHDIPPMIVCTDEEGGLVSSMGRITASAPSAACLGVIDDEAVTEDVYFGVGEKLRALGFNTVFAPVVDVNVETKNPVIGTRSFGSSPDLVAKHGLAAIQGFKRAEIACSMKHFPGHGATTLDSHRTLPVVQASREKLDSRDLEPFFRLVDSDAVPEMVMTAHVAYPGLEKSGDPATLSSSILSGLLRQEMRYGGLIITDSMEMQGITQKWGPEKSAVRALEAGADLILYGLDSDMAAAAYRGVVQAVKSGKISEERIDISVDRVLRLRRNFQGQRWFTDEEAETVLSYEHDQVLFGAAEKGMVVEGNAGVLAEIPRTRGLKLVVLPRELDEHRRLHLRVVREQLQPAGFTVMEVGARPSKEDIRKAEGRAAEARVVVVGTASRGTMGDENKRLVQALTRRDVIKVGVALLDPGDADLMIGANCRIKTLGFGVPHLWALSQKFLG